jgi:hypothetical protein
LKRAFPSIDEKSMAAISDYDKGLETAVPEMLSYVYYLYCCQQQIVKWLNNIIIALCSLRALDSTELGQLA